MSTIRTQLPADPPAWSEHWNEDLNEWAMAAREVLQLNDRTQTVASEYLRWQEGVREPGQDPWWFSVFDHERLAEDLAGGRTTLSSVEKSLAKVAVGVLEQSGEFDYWALHFAGHLTDVLAILGRAAEVRE